jgi:N-acetylneuraminic acid mutarotase
MGSSFFNDALYVTDSSGIYRVDFGPPPAPTLSSISVTPSNPTINVGQTQQFTATGTFSDGSSRDLTSGGGTWATKAPMSPGRDGMGVGVVNGKLYALAGHGNGDSCSYRNTNQAYDPATDTWTTKTPMSTTRDATAAGVVDGIIYVVGGLTGCGSSVASLEAYDPLTDTWTTKTPMPGGGRGALGVGVVNGIIYAMGGHTSSAVATVEAYDPATDSWTTKASMPTARTYYGTGVVNGIIYVAGGITSTCNPCSTVEAYNPETDTWTTKASMPTARYTPAAGVINGILYVVGGGAPDLATVEAYDPATDTWTTKASMPAARKRAAAGVVNGILYVVGHYGPGPYDAQGTNEAFTPGEVTWASSNPAVATINETGLATGLSPGSTDVTATSGSISGSTALAVVNPTSPCLNVTCTPSDQCHDAGVCDTNTGACSNPAKADGAACSDGNACTQTDSCQSGACQGSNPVVCTASDQCHDAGVCDTNSGVCSNPAKADGATCTDGNACTLNDTCQAGSCTSGGADPVCSGCGPGNTPPVVTGTTSSNPMPIGGSTNGSVSASFTDAAGQTHTCSISWGDGSSGSDNIGTVNETDGSGTCTGSHSYAPSTSPVVYTVTVTITDNCGAASSGVTYVIFYDPNGGFVTGGGWINSPAGAYTPNLSLFGKANFGFVSKYKKNAAPPEGETNFHFNTAGFNFDSVTRMSGS